jgi:hypothetical protein
MENKINTVSDERGNVYEKQMPNVKATKVERNEMYRAKQVKLGIDLTVQRDLSRIKFHRFGMAVRWISLTGCEQLEVIDALELALKEAKANAKIDYDESDWKELNKKMKL